MGIWLRGTLLQARILFWHIVGIQFGRMGLHHESNYYHTQIIMHAPTFAAAWNNKGVALWQLGLHEEAIACFDRALLAKPGHGLARKNKLFAMEELRHVEGVFFETPNEL